MSKAVKLEHPVHRSHARGKGLPDDLGMLCLQGITLRPGGVEALAKLVFDRLSGQGRVFCCLYSVFQDPPLLGATFRAGSFTLHELADDRALGQALALRQLEESLFFACPDAALAELDEQVRRNERGWWRLKPMGWSRVLTRHTGLEAPFFFHAPSHESVAMYASLERLLECYEAARPWLGEIRRAGAGQAA